VRRIVSNKLCRRIPSVAVLRPCRPDLVGRASGRLRQRLGQSRTADARGRWSLRETEPERNHGTFQRRVVEESPGSLPVAVPSPTFSSSRRWRWQSCRTRQACWRGCAVSRQCHQHCHCEDRPRI
jgi:hypothetical protein